MAAATPDKIRNVALVGHGASGKTTLVEALLLEAGAISRPGSIDDGNTVCDYDDQEKERKHSIDLACAHLTRSEIEIQLIDTPGYRDFLGQVYCGLAAVECAVIVVDADDGVRPNTRKVWELATARELPCVFVVSRCDRENANPEATLAQIQEQLDAKALPLTIGDGAGGSFTRVEWTLGNDAASNTAKSAGEALLEAVVETDDALMERYLGGEEVTSDELKKQLAVAVEQRAVFPVFFTSAEKRIGIAELIDGLAAYAPPATCVLSRTYHPTGSPDEKAPITTGAGDPFLGLVFKVVADPYVGKLSFLRVFSGSLAHNSSFSNPRTGKSEKVGKIIRLQGSHQDTIDVATAGGIYALLKVEGLQAFDTLTSDRRVQIDLPQLPTPMFSRAVEPKSKADEKKFAEAIAKVVDEDVLIHSKRDSRTSEMVISGMSQLHLLVLWERLHNRYGVEVNTKEPKTPYLETIAAKGDGHYRHKKQSGGAGEFAEVYLRVEPLERGTGLEFVNSVFGGAISASYVGSAEKGIRQVIEHGVIAGCPVVDVKVDIYDGKEHPVDSKDIAFQKAGREAFKLAVQGAKPVLLEPIVDLEVTFPVENMGDIQGDLNRRRGRVVGVDSVGNFQTLRAQVPLAELADYASSLGSVTGGQGTYSIEMSHYEPVPPNVQQKVCEAAKAELHKDD